MKAFRLVFLCVLMLSSITCAEAASWELAYKENGVNKVYVDSSSIVENDIYISFWIKKENEDPFKNKGVKTYFSLAKIDEESFTTVVGKTISYLENGNIVNGGSKEESPFNYASILAYCFAKAEYIQLEKKVWVDASNVVFNDKSFKTYVSSPFLFKGYIYFFNKSEAEDGDTVYQLYKYDKQNNVACQVWSIFLNKNERKTILPIYKGGKEITPGPNSPLMKSIERAKSKLKEQSV